jgi:hypothetical protein
MSARQNGEAHQWRLPVPVQGGSSVGRYDADATRGVRTSALAGA